MDEEIEKRRYRLLLVGFALARAAEAGLLQAGAPERRFDLYTRFEVFPKTGELVLRVEGARTPGGTTIPDRELRFDFSKIL